MTIKLRGHIKEQESENVSVLHYARIYYRVHLCRGGLLNLRTLRVLPKFVRISSKKNVTFVLSVNGREILILVLQK